MGGVDDYWGWERAFLALSDVILALANESYARGVLAVEVGGGQEVDEVRKKCNENLLDGMAKVIVERLMIQQPMSRAFRFESLAEHVKERVRSMVEEWIAGLPGSSFDPQTYVGLGLGFRVRRVKTGETGCVVEFREEHSVVVEWDGPPVHSEVCVIHEIEYV